MNNSSSILKSLVRFSSIFTVSAALLVGTACSKSDTSPDSKNKSNLEDSRDFVLSIQRLEVADKQGNDSVFVMCDKRVIGENPVSLETKGCLNPFSDSDITEPGQVADPYSFNIDYFDELVSNDRSTAVEGWARFSAGTVLAGAGTAGIVTAGFLAFTGLFPIIIPLSPFIALATDHGFKFSIQLNNTKKHVKK